MRRSFLFSCVAQSGVSPSSTSQISGVVQDPSGASVPSAQIQLTQLNTGRVHRVTSNASGSYIIPDLPGGPYTLQATAQGFSTYIQRGIVLEVGSNPEINIKLSVGTVSMEVVVEATAAMVETRSNGVGQVVDHFLLLLLLLLLRQVVELPLNGRDPTQLIALAGATTSAPAGDLNTNKNFPTITIAVAGGLPNGVTYLLDGGTHNDPFNNSSICRYLFRMLSRSSRWRPAPCLHNMATMLRQPVNVVITKSGGNQFQTGDLFEFVRNYAFNAANFFGYNTTTGVKVRDNLEAQPKFGGVIGGPIVKNKLFFFAGYQGTITRSNNPPVNVFVPTQQMMSGDFTTIAQSKS